MTFACTYRGSSPRISNARLPTPSTHTCITCFVRSSFRPDARLHRFAEAARPAPKPGSPKNPPRPCSVHTYEYATLGSTERVSKRQTAMCAPVCAGRKDGYVHVGARAKRPRPRAASHACTLVVVVGGANTHLNSRKLLCTSPRAFPPHSPSRPWPLCPFIPANYSPTPENTSHVTCASPEAALCFAFVAKGSVKGCATSHQPRVQSVISQPACLTSLKEYKNGNRPVGEV